MKGMKGKLLKKLKTIKTIGSLKPDLRILHVNAADGFIENFIAKSIGIVQSQTQTQVVISKEEEDEDQGIQIEQSFSVPVQEPEIIDVSELMKDLVDEDEDMEFDEDGVDDKENIRPKLEAKCPIVPKSNLGILGLSEQDFGSHAMEKPVGCDRKSIGTPLSEIDVSSFRPPDLDSGTLFDPNLLAAFQQAVMEVKAQEAERRARVCQEIDIEEEPPLKSRKIEETHEDPLLNFQEKCPPGGIDSVILYTTGLRGIRKTFEDCSSIRFLLESFRVVYHERDTSMHIEFREELWRVLGGKILPPRLFIKGRYIGGAEEVLVLHERGQLRPLFDGIPINRSEGPCEGCGGARFVMCFSCNGGRKVVLDHEDDGGVRIDCPDCNENGLIICPVCC